MFRDDTIYVSRLRVIFLDHGVRIIQVTTQFISEFLLQINGHALRSFFTDIGVNPGIVIEANLLCRMAIEVGNVTSKGIAKFMMQAPFPSVARFRFQVHIAIVRCIELIRRRCYEEGIIRNVRCRVGVDFIGQGYMRRRVIAESRVMVVADARRQRPFRCELPFILHVIGHVRQFDMIHGFRFILTPFKATYNGIVIVGKGQLVSQATRRHVGNARRFAIVTIVIAKALIQAILLRRQAIVPSPFEMTGPEQTRGIPIQLIRFHRIIGS